jgi:hypothetical protein
MLTAEQLQKIEQDVREFNESTLSGMCLPISGEDAAELVKMARRYAYVRDHAIPRWASAPVEIQSGSLDLPGVDMGVWNEDPDAAIDQAIAESKQA